MKRRFLRLHRRAAIAALSAFLMVATLGMVAFGVDCGYIVLVKTQLQAAADAAAMAAAGSMGYSQATIVATAQEYALYHVAGGKNVSLGSGDVEFGSWDTTTRSFTPAVGVGNAVRITARRNNVTNGEANLFFARIFGRSSVGLEASAIAMANPRDIAFVIDLSGSMNDDTEPGWVTGLINTKYAASSPNIGNTLMQNIYTDFGYGAFPGTLQYVGQPLGVVQDSYAYAQLTKNGGPLATHSNTNYKILNTDTEAQRKTKAYRYIIEQQIAVIMPAVLPAPTNANAGYWTRYIDYAMQSQTVSGGTKGTPPSSRGSLPPSKYSQSITGLNNPNTSNWPSASSSLPSANYNKLGYLTYVQFMADHGRELKPDGTNFVPLSKSSPHCPMHTETVSGSTFSFPPQMQPTHACRRAMIAAMKIVEERNGTIANLNNRDWVSVISFDKLSGTVIRQSLTGNYTTAMTACTTLQEVSDSGASTATEAGLIAANNHIKAASKGGLGREVTNKVVVLLTDGVPNLYQSSNSTVDTYINNNPDPDYYASSKYAYNAPMMQSDMMQAQRWEVFPVGIGFGTDYTFMDKLARMGGTADDDGQSPRGSGDPSLYEQRLIEIFEEIIVNPQVRLVQ